MQINFPEYGFTLDLDRPEIMPALRVILWLKRIECAGRFHRLGHETVPHLHERAGHMHPALDGRLWCYPEAGELAESVILSGDYGGVWAVCQRLCCVGHGSVL